MEVYVCNIDWDTTGYGPTKRKSAAIKRKLPVEATVEIEDVGDDCDPGFVDELIVEALEEHTDGLGLGRWRVNSFTYSIPGFDGYEDSFGLAANWIEAEVS